MSMPETDDTTLLGEERYRLLVDAITDYAIYMLDPDGRIVSWNPGAQRFKGYEASDILGAHFSRFYTEEDQRNDLPARALQSALTEGRFENEGWRVRKDGTRFWAHVVIDPIRDRAGKLLGFAKVTRDLTERRAAEAEIKRNRDQFEMLVQGVTDYALYMLDPDGHVSSWNAGAQRIKGYEAEEIIGRHFSQFYTQDDRTSGEPEKSLEAARSEGRLEREGWRERKDGTRFFAHVVLDTIRDENGDVIGFAKITRDITEKVQIQTALAQAREELFQSQKLEAIGQLTGGIAHDFNNLLMAILGSLEMLRKRMPDDPALLSLLDNAVQGGERGAALTQRMLAFSRRQELDIKAVDLGGLVHGMMDFLQRSLGSSARIETRLPAGKALVVTDPLQLETALLNLIVNARDAIAGEGLIVIGVAEYEVVDGVEGLTPGNYLQLSVTDSGEGMDPETTARATTPFFTTKGVGKGTGLGLSMVQGLTEQSGGKLKIDSEKGKGTTVSLFLPRAPEGNLPSSQPAAGQAQPELPQRTLQVLAVDDDALVLMNTSLMLEDLGHTVTEAYSAGEALDILESGDATFDLVITDHSMPRMTGSELAVEIRRRFPQLPIVLATGYAELPSGGDAKLPRLPKPFSQKQLHDIILRMTAPAASTTQPVPG